MLICMYKTYIFIIFDQIKGVRMRNAVKRKHFRMILMRIEQYFIKSCFYC